MCKEPPCQEGGNIQEEMAMMMTMTIRPHRDLETP